ncbi:multicopper oxidase family protein [Actinomycetes bacterium M1A6_2h]
MTHQVSRRQMLRGLGISSAAITLGTLTTFRSSAAPGTFDSPLIFHSPALEPFRDALPVLPTSSGTDLSITSTTSTHRFHADLPSAMTLTYRVGTAPDIGYLGPVVEAHEDESMTVRYANRIGRHPFAADMDTTLHGVSDRYRTSPPNSMHLHGGVTPPDSDGHTEQLTFPGSDIAHTFPLHQEAMNLWYHDHAMGITRTNVYAGLAGMFLVRDRYDTGQADNPIGLPAGEFEIPLVIQEKILKPDGEMSIRSTPIVPEGSWEGGAVGDLGLVNGVVWPQLDVARGLYRFRLINAASYSVWDLHFENRMRFWIIGNDGGLLDAPVPVTNFRIAPGERYDVLVDFSGYDAGTTLELRNDEAPPFQAAVLGEVTMPLFCRFRVGSARGFTGGVPTSLRGGRLRENLPPLQTPTVVRNVTVSQPYEVRNPPAIMSLNNLRYTDPDIEMPRAGTVEQWNIINVTPDPHPIHIHLVTFRILGRQPIRTPEYQLAHPQPAIGTKWVPSAEQFVAGPMAPPGAHESGWKDTVLTNGGTITRIIVRFPTADELGFDPDALFPRPADPGSMDPGSMNHASGDDGSMDHGPSLSGDLQGYMWHCHILDHEDHDMMLRYRITE